MSFTEEILSQFERYESSTMSQEERVAFEERLRQEEDFRNSFEDFRQMQSGIKAFGYQQFAAQLQSWDEEHDTDADEQVRTLSFSRWYYWAAAVAVIMVATISWWQLSPGQNEQLYTAYFQPYPDVLTSRGENENALNTAMIAYESGEYSEAITLFRQLLEGNGSTEAQGNELRFYLAQAYLSTESYDLAQQLLEDLQNVDQFGLKEASQWYLALAYLKQGDSDTAVRLLQQIKASPNHAYGAQSLQLLKQMN